MDRNKIKNRSTYLRHIFGLCMFTELEGSSVGKKMAQTFWSDIKGASSNKNVNSLSAEEWETVKAEAERLLRIRGESLWGRRAVRAKLFMRAV